MTGHFDCGTRGPSSGLGLSGAPLGRFRSIGGSWGESAGLPGGLPCCGFAAPGAGASRIEPGGSTRAPTSDRRRLVAKNAAASPAVTRVRKLAAPRPVMKPPPPPPMPRAPPSERCSSTAPIRARAIRIWMIKSTVAMRGATFLDGVVAGLLHQLRVRRQQVSAVDNRASAVGPSGGRRVPPLLLFFRFCLGSRLPDGSGRRRIGRRLDGRLGRRLDRGGAGIRLRLLRHRRRRLGLDGCLLGGLRLLVRLRLRGVRRLGFLDCRRRALLVLLALLVWLALLVLLAVVGVRRLLLLGGEAHQRLVPATEQELLLQVDEAPDAVELVGRKIGLRPLRALLHVLLDAGELKLGVLAPELGAGVGIERGGARLCDRHDGGGSEEENQSARGHRRTKPRFARPVKPPLRRRWPGDRRP